MERKQTRSGISYVLVTIIRRSPYHSKFQSYQQFSRHMGGAFAILLHTKDMPGLIEYLMTNYDKYCSFLRSISFGLLSGFQSTGIFRSIFMIVDGHTGWCRQ